MMTFAQHTRTPVEHTLGGEGKTTIIRTATTLTLAVMCGAASAALGGLASRAGLSAGSPPAPVTLDVPASPVPVRAAGRLTLVYELHVADSGSRPLRLERVDVRDAAHRDAPPVATYARSELERDTKLIAPRGQAPATGDHTCTFM